ncbi:ATP-grasp domain-containing protein [Candidatus Spongiihabitans sp.]|uniref:ATP-grasp domain-containing protein n=1 Tax=Candidatus Spongiihabitans sp. TaxID=3101308 RepID=UPI003C6FD13F
MKIAFLYEHPTWSDTLIAAFDHRGVALTLRNIAELSFDADATDKPFDAAINRINVMPSAEREPQIVFQTLHYLNWLELAGVRVINGARAHFIGASKAMQNGIFSALGMAHPRAVAIYRPADALAVADSIGYPVIIKPNIGGSGSGIARYNTRAELAETIRFGALDLGVDRSGLVQQYIESDGYVYRVEVLGDQLFYSIRQPINERIFNYCAADRCVTASPSENGDDTFNFCVHGRDRIEAFSPSESIVAEVIKIVRHCGADLGGVEYLIDPNTDAPCFYDFNPYSNFVSNGEALLGFSPENRYIDFILESLGTAQDAMPIGLTKLVD